MTELVSPLVARIAGENKRVLLMLLVGLGVNVLLYAFGVYPLSQRVANVSDRNASAARPWWPRARRTARVTGTLAGKDRAVTELATFYTSVLPRDLASARRLTHLRIAQLAREHGLRLLAGAVRAGGRARQHLDAAQDRRVAGRQLHGDSQLRPRARNGARVRGDRQRRSWPKTATRAKASS